MSGVAKSASERDKHFHKANLLPAFRTIQDITHLKEFEECDFTVFDIIIPVTHKSTTLALVFVGGLEKDARYQNEDGIKFIQAPQREHAPAAGDGAAGDFAVFDGALQGLARQLEQL